MHRNFLKKLSRKTFHDLLLEIIISSSINKNEWLTDVVIELLGRDIIGYPIWINQNIPKDKKAIYAKYINRVFEIVNESSIEEVYKLMFFKKFTHISKGDSRLKLTQLLNQTFGAVLEFDINSYKYGVKLAPFWSQELDNYKVKQDLIFKYFSSPAVESFNSYNNLIFEYGLPNVGKLRQKLIDQVISNYKKYNFDEMMALISALKNPVFKRELVKKDKSFERPVFSIERAYLNSQLEESPNSWVAFQLLYLGQRDELIIKNLMVDL